jgi:hypothetical protein
MREGRRVVLSTHGWLGGEAVVFTFDVRKNADEYSYRHWQYIHA